MEKQLTIFNRNQSYIETLESLPKAQSRVYKAIIHLKKASNREISEWLHLPINCITGRSKELREKGLVIEAGSKFDTVTNRNVTLFEIV